MPFYFDFGRAFYYIIILVTLKKDMGIVAELKYKPTRDTVSKLVFTHNPHLLERMTPLLLGVERIDNLKVENSEVYPGYVGGKFCRLDINMTVDGRLVDFEVQEKDEGDFRERSMFYWASQYTNAIVSGKKYRELPEVVVVSILNFNLFKDSSDIFTEVRPVELRRQTVFTPMLHMRYFELPKLPKIAQIDATNELMLWLAFFNAKTDEDLETLLKIGGPIMAEAIEAYRTVTASEELQEFERMRTKARLREEAALSSARGQERAEISAEIAKKMKEKGKDVNEIVEFTGLTVDDVLKL